jgi:hypothetical protein
MNDALNILLKEGPLDPASEALLCEELAITSEQIETLKLSSEHEALVDRVENMLKRNQDQKI